MTPAPQLSIDINCDMGESFGAWRMGDDASLMPLITSANIACGFHAGDPSTMRKTVALAIEHGVAIGAHPGLPDLSGFGRRTMMLSPSEVYDLVIVQIGSLAAVAASQGASLHHVKAHGALYNMAASNDELAMAVAQAVYDVDPSLILYALANSKQVAAAQQLGLRVAQEVFADRSYQANGLLTPRNQAHALITDPHQAAKQVVNMVLQGRLTALSGQCIAIQADTLCLHGDQPHALDFAKLIHRTLEQNKIQITSVL